MYKLSPFALCPSVDPCTYEIHVAGRELCVPINPYVSAPQWVPDALRFLDKTSVNASGDGGNYVVNFFQASTWLDPGPSVSMEQAPTAWLLW